jgi:hypothetical protein
LPARVYWTRRILVLTVALLLVVGIGTVLGGGSDAESGADDTAARASGEIKGTAPTTQATVEPSPTVTRKPRKARKTKPPLAQPDGPCAPEEVTVEPLIERATGGRDIRIPFRLTTTVPACSFTFSNDTVAVKITSGDDLIWTSLQCRTLPRAELVVRAEKPARATMTWNARRSNEECQPASAAWAEKGYYHAVAAVLGGEPTDVQFKLVNPRAATITKAPKPKQKQKDEQGESRPTEEPRDDRRDGATEPG